MQVVPILFDEDSEDINYSYKWDFSYPSDIGYRFDSYITEHRLLGSWGSRGTLDENFLVIF